MKTTKKLKVDTELCKGCGLCVMYCPRKCLNLSTKFNSAGHHPVELVNEEACSSCGNCYIMCPDYAITIE